MVQLARDRSQLASVFDAAVVVDAPAAVDEVVELEETADVVPAAEARFDEDALGSRPFFDVDVVVDDLVWSPFSGL